MEEDSILYKIKELEKIILKNLAKPVINKEYKTMQKPTPTQMRIANYILNNIDKEDIYQKDIEKALNLSKATVSDVLNRMEKNGLIKRNINPNDTRSKKILLNENIKKSFRENKKRLQELEKIAGKDITKEELETFSNILNKMIKNLETKKEQ